MTRRHTLHLFMIIGLLLLPMAAFANTSNYTDDTCANDADTTELFDGFTSAPTIETQANIETAAAHDTGQLNEASDSGFSTTGNMIQTTLGMGNTEVDYPTTANPCAANSSDEADRDYTHTPTTSATVSHANDEFVSGLTNLRGNDYNTQERFTTTAQCDMLLGAADSSLTIWTANLDGYSQHGINDGTVDISHTDGNIAPDGNTDALFADDSDVSDDDQVTHFSQEIHLKAPHFAVYHLSDGNTTATSDAVNMRRAHSPMIVANVDNHEAAATS